MKKITSNLTRFVKFGKDLEIKPFENKVSDKQYQELSGNKIFKHYLDEGEFKVEEIEDEKEPETIELCDLEKIKTLEIDELKELYTVDQLKATCKSLNMRKFSDLSEVELIEKLKAKISES